MSHRLVLFAAGLLVAAMPSPGFAASGQTVVAPTAAQTAALPLSVSRDRVTVRRDRIRLGDLFTNTGDKADMVVEHAPAAGSQSVFDVYRLAAIAQSHGLVWQARSWSEKVVIERASQTIPADRVVAALRAAVQHEMGIEGHFEIEMTGRDLALTLPAEVNPAVTVESLRIQRDSGQFTAIVAAPAMPKVNVSGHMFRVIDVPTLNRRISSGDIIAAEDINWVALRADRVSRNFITEADRIIGMTPTRTLVAGKAVLTGEVRPPRVVLKGSLVIMQLRTPHMTLSSKGRAMEHGAKGEVIKVMNIQSKTIVEGEVTSSGAIEVSIAALPRSATAQVAGSATSARR